MKERVIKFFLYAVNALTIQYFISFGRGERTDYIKLIILAIVFFLAGYIVKHFEKKITVNACVLLAIALGLPLTGAITGNWMTNWILEVVIGLTSFFGGFFTYYLSSAKAIIGLSTLTVFVSFVAFYISPRVVYYNYSRDNSRKEKNDKVISFIYTDRNTTKISSESFKGKVVLIDYWFIGCTPCYWKMKELAKLAEYYDNNKDVRVVTVNAGFRDSFDRYKKETEKFPASMEHLYDSAANVAKDLNIQGYPTEFIIDKNGVIRDEFAGYTKDIGLIYFEKTKAKIDAILKEN